MKVSRTVCDSARSNFLLKCIHKCICRPIDIFADDKNCAICLKNFEQDDIVNTLPCKHRFHSDCIKKWLRKVTIGCITLSINKLETLSFALYDILMVFGFRQIHVQYVDNNIRLMMRDMNQC